MDRISETDETVENLSLESLKDEVHPGIFQELKVVYCRAAALCLDEQNHVGGIELTVDGSFDKLYSLHWEKTTPEIQRSLADPDVATEYGACCIAALLISKLTDYQIVLSAKKGTHIDYWLGLKNDQNSDFLFQNKARLEVSGIRNGDESRLRRRVKEKLDRIETSEKALPAYICVTEFGSPKTRMVKK